MPNTQQNMPLKYLVHVSAKTTAEIAELQRALCVKITLEHAADGYMYSTLSWLFFLLQCFATFWRAFLRALWFHTKLLMQRSNTLSQKGPKCANTYSGFYLLCF